jgi:SAM-dependent methyltransferase
MIDSILTELSNNSFDFREFANPADPLSTLFEEWIPYYRLKFCIAKVLQPKSILEIGVRFGYSARAFLEASPSATLLGIDLDSDSFGGQVGALDWARQITANFEAEYVVADSQKMKRFPNGIYDLIHVDGQQDGYGTFHDLRRAVSQGRWVLLDGYFWTRSNFLDANDFLLKFKEVISYAVTIPGYAGELLIKVSEDYLSTVGSAVPPDRRPADQAASFYSSNYMSEVFGSNAVNLAQKFGLPSFLALTRLAHGRTALALGCGWGDLAHHLAASLHEVTAVDDASSIALAKKRFASRDEEFLHRVEFICADVTRFDLEREFDVAVATDLIEQLPAADVARLYERVAHHLGDDGVFIIHTYPNVWFYKRNYPRLRAAVEKVGGYLPAEPRSRYELLMHINEQSPAVLRRTLARSFRHVKVWSGDAQAPGENLLRRCSISELIKAPDIYALASQSPLELERAKRLLTQPELPPGSHAQIMLSVAQWPKTVSAGSAFTLAVTVANESTEPISSMPPYPINISYHWSPFEGTRCNIFEGQRTNLPFPLSPGERQTVLAIVEAPPIDGTYRLQVTLVQEKCCWFDTVDGAARPSAKIIVV